VGYILKQKITSRLCLCCRLPSGEWKT